MIKVTLTSLGIVALLCGTAVAAESPVDKQHQTLAVKLTGKAGRSSGLVASMTTRTDSGAKPSPVTKVVLRLPASTTIDTSAAPVCRATAHAVIFSKGKVCAKSLVGRGTATVDARPLTSLGKGGFIPATVTAYNLNRGIMFLAYNTVSPQAFSGTIRRNVLTVTVPELPAGAAMTEFRLVLTPHRRGAHVYLRAPRTCRKVWATVGRFTYKSAAAATVTSVSSCRR